MPTRGSTRDLPQAELDQLRGRSLLSGGLECCGDRRAGLRLAVAEIDQRRDRVSHGPRQRSLALDRSAEPRHQWIMADESRRLVLQLAEDALGEPGADALGALQL